MVSKKRSSNLDAPIPLEGTISGPGATSRKHTARQPSQGIEPYVREGSEIGSVASEGVTNGR